MHFPCKSLHQVILSPLNSDIILSAYIKWCMVIVTFEEHIYLKSNDSKIENVKKHSTWRIALTNLEFQLKHGHLKCKWELVSLIMYKPTWVPWESNMGTLIRHTNFILIWNLHCELVSPLLVFYKASMLH